jgi:hypothetical protein
MFAEAQYELTRPDDPISYEALKAVQRLLFLSVPLRRDCNRTSVTLVVQRPLSSVAGERRAPVRARGLSADDGEIRSQVPGGHTVSGRRHPPEEHARPAEEGMHPIRHPRGCSTTNSE